MYLIYYYCLSLSQVADCGGGLGQKMTSLQIHEQPADEDTELQELDQCNEGRISPSKMCFYFQCVLVHSTYKKYVDIVISCIRYALSVGLVLTLSMSFSRS